MPQFRILSLDGGGIRGVFAASFLANLERITGKSVTRYFDLIAGTSTGGIIALGLGLGISPADILRFYEEKGPVVFPVQGWLSRKVRWLTQWFMSGYSPAPLENALKEVFQTRRLGESTCRLVIPAFDAIRGDVYIYKTAHHARLREDYETEAWRVAMATAAAPTYFPAFETDGGTELIDGGMWANNPSMVALTEAIALLAAPVDQVSMLSIGTTESPLMVGTMARKVGGRFFWALSGADLFLRGQSLAATNQCALILGDRFIRVNPTVRPGRYGLDTVRMMGELKGLGGSEARHRADHIERLFLPSEVQSFVPIYAPPQH